jgi:MauM/NapG family ferredoxin protein
MQWARRVSQVLFLALFFALALRVRLSENGAPVVDADFFFKIDPLVSLSTALAARSLAVIAIPALVVLVATVLLGRVFCGWICPLGAVHAAASWFRAKRPAAAPPERRTAWHRVKYVVLVALLVMALFGAHWTGIFDPIPLLFRSTATFLLPAAQYAVEDSSTAVFQADPHVGPAHLKLMTEPVYKFSRNALFQVDRQTYAGAAFIAALFILIVALNLVRPRFWCRYVCPLGGLLGFASLRPALRLKNDKDRCNGCGQCARACPAAAQPDRPGEWLPTECYDCWNCVASCRRGALAFKVENPITPAAAGGVDFSRRAAMGASAAGVAVMLGFRQNPLAQEKVYEANLVRPPGALPEREFLQRCVQCGACMRACPTNALQPCALEGGIEGLWTPRIIAKVGYCEYNCNICGQVCPTGAIQPLAIEAKKEVKIGLAFFDKDRCLPYAFGRECIVCEEHCPTPQKSIYFVEREVELRDGQKMTVKQPQVDPDKCTGCGICEWCCVFRDTAAVRVTSANETRHSNNQPILPGGAGGSPY